jgi:hypothetical protein
MPSDDLGRHLASTVLAEDLGRDSYGVTRILASSAGTPGEEREYEPGDEALVEAGLAEWVVAPVHHPSAGRRLDTDAEREPTPLGGIEAYPPAEPTSWQRRAEARDKGSVGAHADEGLAEKLAARRFEVARDLRAGDDAEAQAELGSLGARSGPVTKPSELAADKALAAGSAAVSDGEAAQKAQGDPKADPKAALGRHQQPSPQSRTPGQ